MWFTHATNWFFTSYLGNEVNKPGCKNTANQSQGGDGAKKEAALVYCLGIEIFKGSNK